MSYNCKLITERISFSKGLFIIIALFAMIISLIVIGCGKDGVLENIDRPEVFITSYEGVDDPATIDKPYFFQRRIFWRGESSRGRITGFAYRILEDDGETPYQSPRTYIDPDGWVYHYKPGADESIPLTGDPQSLEVRTIWTTQTHDVIHFPGTRSDGDSTAVTSIFELKCKDHYEQESDTIRRYFNVVSHVPNIDVIFSDRFRPIPAAAKEEPYYPTLGLGFEVEFEMEENTPYTTPQNRPNYFKFRIERRNIATQEVLKRLPEQENEWFDTQNQSNVSRIWLAQQDDDPSDFNDRDDVYLILTPDEFENNDRNKPITETILYMKAVNFANVHSPIQDAKFRVYDNFRPQALVYTEGTNVLGRNHFTTYQDGSLSRPLPEVPTPEGTHFGTPFFPTKDGTLAALWSDDIRIYLRWGWEGQYENNDPDRGFINEVHDAQTGDDYLTAIKAFDLRLGDSPYPFPPLVNHPDYETKYRYLDSDGTEWLRVPRFHEIDTRALLSGIPPGEYSFQVRVVDAQNRFSAVEEFPFKIAETVTREEKNGILIIDNETFPNPAFKEYTVNYYQEILDNMDVDKVDVISRHQMRNKHEDLGMHFGRIFLSTADLEPYRLVIWHSDNPADIGPNNANMHQEYEVLNLYLRGGGNVLVSAGSNLNAMKRAADAQAFFNFTFHNYFGLPFRNDEITGTISTSMTARPYFKGAKPEVGAPLTFNDIDVNPEHPFLDALRLDAFGTVTYFNEDYLLPSTKPIYRIKATEEGEEFDGLPIAIRTKTNNNNTYMFGFPLSFMKQDQVIEMLSEIYKDVSN